MAAPAAIAFPFGIYQAIVNGAPAPAIIAALFWLAGAMLFLTNLVRLAVVPARFRSPVPAE